MKKPIVCLFICFMAIKLDASAATDLPVDLPYESYIYNSNNQPVSIPAPYTVGKTVTGDNMGLGSFDDLSDMFYDGNETLYICDSGNNRILVTDTDFNLKTAVKDFMNQGKIDSFDTPRGVYANETSIYIADSQNARIVVLDKASYQLIRILNRPNIALLGENYVYTPTSLAVDNAGRIYVIASGINQGLICLDQNGNFSTFLGAPTVVPDLLDILWRKLATKKQKEQMEQYVPTEYTSMEIDDHGFIYVVSQTSSSMPVAKLNSNGDDVLNLLQGSGTSETSYGDLAYSHKRGEEVTPYFTDITIDKIGTYFLLDSKQGKIYVYSKDGYLMYAFGANGSQKGTFFSASSIEKIGDQIIVADRSKDTITVFSLSVFGKDVINALARYDSGDYKGAADMWRTVYNQASNYTPAVIGLAKIDMQNGDYSSAMTRLKSVREHTVYSKAFDKWRDLIIRKSFYWVFPVLLAFVVLYYIFRRYIKKSTLYQKWRNNDWVKKFKYGTYIMFHPFDGFWDIKREKKGDLKTAQTIFIAFLVCYAVRAQFSGYVVTKTISSEVNVIYECALIVFPLAFWIVSNWCFTALMDGEGSIKDITIATCYSLKPYVIFSVPMFILSHVLTAQETVFYTVLDNVCLVWILGLLFFGMMVTHDYTLSKSLLTLALTLVGICLIIFILLLFANVMQEVFSFGYNIYKELVFRTY